MPLSRRTLALPCALLVTLVGASSAQAAITITSPANEGFTNNLRPTVTFTGAAPNGPVTLEVAGSAVVGSTVADSNGDGTVTPTTDIVGPARERFGITLRDPDGVSPNLDTVTVHVDQAPSISGIGDGTTTVPAGVTFNASDAVPSHGVKLYIDGVLDQTSTADDDGWILTDIVPHVTLTPGSHTAWMTSLDDHGVESSPSDTVHFDIAPPAPTFTQVFEGVQLNQALPPVTFHDVNPTATKVSLYELDDDGDEVAVGDTAVVAGGAATIVPTAPLADGRHYLVAKQTVNGVETVDYLGDNGPTTAIVKTSAPVLALSAQNPLVSNTRPSFGVTGALANLVDNDTFVELYIDGQPAGHDGADGGGTTSLRPDGAVGQGAHSAYVITVDALGHRSAAHSNTVNFAVDTVGPAAPTVTSPANGSTIACSPPVGTATP